MINGLAERSGIAIMNLAEFGGQCLESHDCLDSVVAAVAAALWVKDPYLFRRPGDPRPGDTEEWPPAPRRRQASAGAMAMTELDAARLEGWIYAPYPVG